MTELLADWLADRAYYTIGLQQGPAATDNPDQRIAEDLKSFTDDTLRLGLEFLSQIVTLISFVAFGFGGFYAFCLFSLAGHSLTRLALIIPIPAPTTATTPAALRAVIFFFAVRRRN